MVNKTQDLIQLFFLCWVNSKFGFILPTNKFRRGAMDYLFSVLSKALHSVVDETLV